MLQSAQDNHIEEEPLLARRPWIGIFLFILGTAVFSLLAYHVVTNGPLVALDKSMSVAIHQWATHSPKYVVLTMLALSASGREGIMLISLLAAIVWIKRKYWRGVAMVFYGIAGGEGLFQFLSNVINRHRPVWPDPLEVLPGPGFPSGHNTTAVLLAFMIVYVLWPGLKAPARKVLAVILATAWVLLVGLARSFMGMHFPTDILAGYAAGLAWAGLVYTTIDWLYYRARRQKPYVPSQTAQAP